MQLKENIVFLAIKKQTGALEKGNQIPDFNPSRYDNAYESMEFYSRWSVHELFQKSGISEKSMKALNDEHDPLISLDVEEDVMESLKDNLEKIRKNSMKIMT